MTNNRWIITNSYFSMMKQKYQFLCNAMWCYWTKVANLLHFFLCDETCWLVISMFTWHTIIFSRINLLKVMKFLLKTVVCWYFSWYHHECNQFKFQQSTVQLVTAVQQETIIYNSQSDDVMTQLNCINHLVHGCANMSYPGPDSLVNISIFL